jgi:ferric-dicitrate binding protein FerR (iron transport regulator)
MMTADDTMEEYRKHAAPAQEPAAQEPRGIRLTEEQLRARRARSIAIALALGAFVAVIFAVTIVRLGSNVFTGPDYMRPVQTTR